MKQTILMLLIFELFACNQQTDKTRVLQTRIDSLESRLADAYKPGFGEFMSSVQAHHAKLWFAGQNENWTLADFEVHEIVEALEDIEKYQAERPESQNIGMINPALDSVRLAIKQKSPIRFKSTYARLTNACNTCHRAVNFDFNVVKIPDNQTFSNQDFKANQR